MATSSDGKPEKVRTISLKQRAHLAAIAPLGGRTVTAKKRKHLATLPAQGGKVVTPRKLESLRKAREARAAKALRDKTA